MNLSKKSWYAKLYNKVYGFGLPTNLCPLFWKLVFGIVSSLFFFFWWYLPFEIYNVLRKKNKREPIIYATDCFIPTTGINLLLFFLAMIALSIRGLIYHIPLKEYDGVYLLGMMGTIIILAVLGGTIYEKRKDKKNEERNKLYKENKKAYYEKYFSEKEPKKKRPNILIEFIKSKYKKNCPIIKWED